MVAMSGRYRTTVDPSADNNPHSYAIELVGSGHRVLEVGCSVGHVSEHLLAAGNTVVGVEIDETSAIEARDVLETVHVLDLDTTALTTVEHGEFDVIVLGDVLEHLRDPAPVLADLVTLLASDGSLVISIPNLAHVDVRLMLLEGRVEYQDDGLLDRTHLRWFTKSSLRDLLASQGFVATDVRRVIFPLGGSNVPFDRAVHSDATIDFVMADPEALTYQYVVKCRRGTAEPSDDLLADIAPQWPQHSCPALADELQRTQQALATAHAEVQAWERSNVARLSRPIRAVSGRLRRAIAARH